MERKTQVTAAEGRQDLTITRTFDLPLELLFKAYEDPEIVAQWMGTKVLKLENRKHGGYQFETYDPKGNLAFKANGTIHEFVTNEKITRTFEMENSAFGVTLEFLEFECLTADTSRLSMHVIYRSAAHRDENLKLPFDYGVNMAHNRLQEILNPIK
jgi:uncharacterized protein YndB with AHSA1/START domain